MACYNGPFYCIQRLHRLLVAYTSSIPNDEWKHLIAYWPFNQLLLNS